MSWIKPILKHLQWTKWKWLPIQPKHIWIGNNTDIGATTVLLGHQGIVIEDNVQIGPGCVIMSISTIDGKQGTVTLKRNCKIGANSVVMPGVTVGENSVVGAMSFVSTNIPDNEVWYGTPAQFRRYVECH